MNNTVDPSLFYDNRARDVKKTGQGALGKDDFLKILITQLQNQDPTNPMDDREFISQMAQFSSLEQMTNMNRTLEKFITSQTDNKLIQNSHLIGKEVQWQREGSLSDRDLETNTVKSVRLRDGDVSVQLDNGNWILVDQIKQISSSGKE
ncbi:flagellar hook assembly protein FlgD [Alkalihalobacterium chitinilyticum]|uniref:Flagellar hook assembly protein FlgD n=1 Tax=Alkalihalobacterium chitinilyticum TaxID=2980103 RepID=A0ABT5VE19_9BACI|nr:flagellar hook assembly protein FlgD [Alkalihalobacterium chitinilyticum]MDE5412962.1 flagellar hook assembly protein FlgD [Alkalihalobacterium chitinilyticum]